MSRIRANQITNQSADGAPTVQHGLIIAGVSTFTGSVSIGGTLTYEDVTNIDSVGIVTARGGIHIDDSIVHIGDTNTKIRFPSADTVTAETAGSERLRINSQGKVLVNTTTASSAGNSQYSRLEVSGNSSSSTGPGHLSLKRGTASASLSNGDTLSRLIFSSLDGGDFAYIQASVDGSPSGSDFPASLRFHTCADGASSSTERLRIDSSGRMGLGTNSPTKKLTVQAGSNNADIALLTGNDLNRGLLISTVAANSQNDMGVVYNAHGQHSGSYLGEHIFKTNNTERLRITSDGDVAITTRGTVEGVSKLNVEIPSRTTAFSASDGDTWHDVLIENPGSATTNAIGLCFQVTGDSYHKNAGTGIAAVKNGTDSDYGADLVFITRPQNAVAAERLRIDSNGYVTKPAQPSFHARRTNNVSSTQNPLVYDSVHQNNGSHYKSSGTDQGKFVAPVSGVYLFYWTAIKTNNGSVCRLYINVDGSHIYSNMHLRLQEQGTYSNGSMQAVVNLNAGQKVHISLEAGSIHGNEYTHFGGYLIG